MHPDTGRHDTGWGHPEHMGRLPAVVRAIERDTPALLHAVRSAEPDHATVDDLLLVHQRAHVDGIAAACEEAEGRGAPLDITGDTVVSGASWDAALAAAGCAIDAAAAVATGATETAFALCRPPGHHATSDLAMGFCLFNNVAIAARTAARDHGVERILIVDWDVHHGNGTQDIFYEDGSVYYLSLHQHPWYPGTGSPSERGRGAGAGTTRNVQVAAGTPREAYMETFTASVDAALDEFTPDLILVSAGYDCMSEDPLGGLLLEPTDLHAMTRVLVERAVAVSGARVAVVLEGGYSPARMGRGIVATIHGLCGLDGPD